MDDITITGERVTLRTLTEANLPRLLEIVNAPEIVEWWPDYDYARLHADTMEDPDTVSLAIELAPVSDGVQAEDRAGGSATGSSGGEFVGLIMFGEQPDPYYRHASIDITLDPEHLGQGLGSDALRTLVRYLFEVRGHHRITIDPALSNERAIGMYKKLGFQPVGIMRSYERGLDGAWRDGLLMDMLVGELR